MRPVTFEERRKRGCCYCADYTKVKLKYAVHWCCPYSECPYHGLDKYDTYRDYLKHEAPLVKLSALLGLNEKTG